jgi:hypothetical protein
MQWRFWALPVLLVLLVALRPWPAAAQPAVELDPARTYSLFSIAQVQRDGGPVMPPGTFGPSGRASEFNRVTLVFRLSLKGDPNVRWLIRFGQQIDSIDLVLPNGSVVHTGMAVPFSRRPVSAVVPTLAVPPDVLDGTPFEVRMTTTTEVRAPLLMTAAAARAIDD